MFEQFNKKVKEPISLSDDEIFQMKMKKIKAEKNNEILRTTMYSTLSTKPNITEPDKTTKQNLIKKTLDKMKNKNYTESIP